MSSPGPEVAPTRRACVSCGREFSEEIPRCPDDGTLLTPLADQPVVGAVLGDRYEITGVIAGGGMGTIFRGKHQLMKRTVAIKMLHPQLVSSAATLKRFQQEAEAASCLNHPNILSVFDFGLSAQGKPYLVMDCLEGTSLATLLASDGHLPAGRSLRIFVQIAAALAHAHQKGVIHRDLKPANIMLIDLDGDPDFVKLVDFGIAKMMSPQEGEGSNLTKSGEVFGSPLYMSPEQCLGNPIDPRTDIYSLACVMYRTLTGVTPAAGNDLLELMYKHANVMPEGFATVCPELNLSPELEAVVFKALSKKPEERYQSMEELRAAMESLVEFKEAGGLPTSPGRPTAEIPVSALDVITDSQVTVAGADQPTPSEPAKVLSEQAATESFPVFMRLRDFVAQNLPRARQFATQYLGRARQFVSQNLPLALQALVKHRWAAIASFAVVLLAAVMFLKSDGDKAGPPATTSATISNPASQQSTAGTTGTQMTDQQPAAGSLSDLFDLHIKSGQVNFERGNYLAAEEHFNQAYHIAENFGQWDPRNCTCMVWAARVYIAQGRYGDASKALDWVLEFRKRRFGYKSQEVADTLVQMSAVARQQGNIRRAKALLKQAEAIQGKHTGKAARPGARK